MLEPREPRSFSCTDDAPTNTGWIGREYDYDEIRLTGRQKYPDIDDPTEDCFDEPEDWEGEMFD